jgi:serine protease Do
VQGVRSYTSLEVGQDVFAVGNPHALESTFTPGVISGKRQDNGLNYIQTTAPITHGSSGGGLFDRYGNLVGINTAIIEGTGNLGFAIAADEFWDWR